MKQYNKTKKTIQQNKKINEINKIINAVSYNTVQGHPHTDKMAY